MKNNLFLALAALAASSSLIAPTVAEAQQGGVEQFSERVSYSDLNLATDAGQQRLDQRIASAVRSLCETGGRDLRSRILQAECIDRARQSADRQVRLAVVAYRNKARRA